MQTNLKCVRSKALILVILCVVNLNCAFEHQTKDENSSKEYETKSKTRRRIYDRFEFSEDFEPEPQAKFDISFPFEEQEQTNEANFPELSPFQSDHLMPFRIPQFKDHDQYLKLDDVRSDVHQDGSPHPPTFGFVDYYEEEEPEHPEQSFNYYSKPQENTISRPKIKVQYHDKKPLDPVHNVGYSGYVTTKPIDTTTKGIYYKTRIVKKVPKYSKIANDVKNEDSYYEAPKPSSNQYGDIKPSKPSYEEEKHQVYYKPIEIKTTTHKPVVYYKPVETTPTSDQYGEPPAKSNVYYKPLTPTQDYEQPISTNYEQPKLVHDSPQNTYQSPEHDPILNEVDYSPPKVPGTKYSSPTTSSYQSPNISKYNEEPMPMVYYKPLAVVPTEPGFYAKPLAIVPTVQPYKKKRTRKTKPRYNRTQSKPCDQDDVKHVPKAKPSYQPPSKKPSTSMFSGLGGIFSLFSKNQNQSYDDEGNINLSKPTYHTEMKPPGPRYPGNHNAISEIQSGYGEDVSMQSKIPPIVGTLLTCLPLSIAAALVPIRFLDFNPNVVTVTPDPSTLTVTQIVTVTP